MVLQPGHSEGKVPPGTPIECEYMILMYYSDQMPGIQQRVPAFMQVLP